METKGLQNILPQADTNHDYYIFGRHGGRRADSLFSFPNSDPGKFVVNFSGLTPENEWRKDYTHIIPRIGESVSDSRKTPGVSAVYAESNTDLNPLTVGGTKQLKQFYKWIRLHNILPKDNYVYLHSSLTRRTVQTSSLFWKYILKKPKHRLFTLDNSIQASPVPLQIVTSSPFLTGDKIYGSQMIKREYYGTPPPFPADRAYHTKDGVYFGNASNFRPEIYDNGQSVNWSAIVPRYDIGSILERLLPVTGFKREDLQSSLQKLVLWIIMQHIDQGPWVHISKEEFIILNNFYFTNIYSYGTRLIAGPCAANIVADLHAWVEKSSDVYKNGGNVVFIGHENYQHALITVLDISHDYHIHHRSFIPGGMMVFVRNRSTNQIMAFSMCPSTDIVPDDNFHVRLNGGVSLNETIARAAREYPPV